MCTVPKTAPKIFVPNFIFFNMISSDINKFWLSCLFLNRNLFSAQVMITYRLNLDNSVMLKCCTFWKESKLAAVFGLGLQLLLPFIEKGLPVLPHIVFAALLYKPLYPFADSIQLPWFPGKGLYVKQLHNILYTQVRHGWLLLHIGC